MTEQASNPSRWKEGENERLYCADCGTERGTPHEAYCGHNAAQPAKPEPQGEMVNPMADPTGPDFNVDDDYATERPQGKQEPMAHQFVDWWNENWPDLAPTHVAYRAFLYGRTVQFGVKHGAAQPASPSERDELIALVIDEINSSTGPTGGWLDSPKVVLAAIVERARKLTKEPQR